MNPEDFREMLLASQKDQKGVQIYVNGQTIAMIATSVGLEYVEGKSREFSKILVRMDRIDGIARS